MKCLISFAPTCLKHKIKHLKHARWCFGCLRVGNLVYVIDGRTEDGPTEDSENLKSVEVYNLDTNIWSDVVDLPEALSGSHACACTNKFE